MARLRTGILDPVSSISTRKPGLYVPVTSPADPRIPKPKKEMIPFTVPQLLVRIGFLIQFG